MPTNQHHKWLKKGDWPSAKNAMKTTTDGDGQNIDLLLQHYKELDSQGRLPHHYLAENAQTHTHQLAFVGVWSIGFNSEALVTRDNNGETPLDIAIRSNACDIIYDLLSLTPKSAHSLGGDKLRKMYAPVAYYYNICMGWIESRSWDLCHKWIDEHHNKNHNGSDLIRQVLEYENSQWLRIVACQSQRYSDSLVHLALRMVHRHPLSLTATYQGCQTIYLAEHPDFNACQEVSEHPAIYYGYSHPTHPTHIIHTELTFYSSHLHSFGSLVADCKRPPPPPHPSFRHPLPRSPPNTPPQAVRRRGDLRHLQHRLHVHQAHEVRQGRVGKGGGCAEPTEKTGSQVRRLQLLPSQALREVHAHVLLLPLLPEVCVEEAQEVLQSNPSRE